MKYERSPAFAGLRLVLTTSHVGNAAATIVAANTTPGIILICTHDAKVYM